jgi:hypothetical protein
MRSSRAASDRTGGNSPNRRRDNRSKDSRIPSIST